MENIFEGKTAVITGGSSGIGEGLARRLAEEGANVVLAARNRARLKQAVDQLREIRPDGQYLTVRANVRAESQIESLKAKTLAAFDTVDILINNAGIGAWHEIVDMPTREWNAVIETNLTGVFLATRAFLPIMMQQGSGHILNISSVAGKLGFKSGSAYCASKWGLLGFTRALAEEARPHGVRVDALCPGTVETPFKNSPAASDIRLEVEDIVRAAVYLMTLPKHVRVDDIVMYPQG